MKKALFAATILAASVSTTAEAQDNWPYWYVGLNAGATYQTDSDFTSTSGGGSTGEYGYDTGSQYGGSIGYMLTQDDHTGRTRAEIEYSYREQGFEGGTGEVQANVVTANLYHDFKAQGSNVMPYVGAGVGVADIDVSAANPSGAIGDDSVPVYQLMAGVGYALENVPRTEISVGYKYLGTFSDPDVANAVAGQTEFELDGHSVEVGAKFRF